MHLAQRLLRLIRGTAFLSVMFTSLAFAGNKVVVLGDVEGQWDRYISFFENSEAFEIHPGQGIILKPGYDFIFMGDAVDKGDASVQIVETLTKLKSKYPSRVRFLMGNRDANKMRFVYELSEEGLKNPPRERADGSKFQDWMTQNQVPQELYSDGPTRLKWILEKTMAAPGAFEFRRTEMQSRLQREVSDQEVFAFFRDDLGPSGSLAKYLKQTQVAYADWKNRTLFVHGGISLQAIGHIPGRSGKIEDLSKWISQLNAWARKDILQTLQDIHHDSGVLKYQQSIPGSRTNPYSLVYGRNTDDLGNPEMIPLELQEMLLKQGIDTIVVGHTPLGEIPVVLSNGRFRIIFVDNSMSEMRKSAKVIIEKRKVRVKAQSPSPQLSGPVVYTHELGMNSIIGTQGPNGVVVAVQNGQALAVKIERKSRDYFVTYTTHATGIRDCRELIRSSNP